MSETPSTYNKSLSLEELSANRKSRLQQLRNKRRRNGTSISTLKTDQKDVEEKLIRTDDNKKEEQEKEETERLVQKDDNKEDEGEEEEGEEEEGKEEKGKEEKGEEEENNDRTSAELATKEHKILKTVGRNYNPITKAPVNSFEIELPNNEGIISLVTSDKEENRIMNHLSEKFKVNDNDDDEENYSEMKKKVSNNFLFDGYKHDLKKFEDELNLKTERMLKNILKERVLSNQNRSK